MKINGDSGAISAFTVYKSQSSKNGTATKKTKMSKAKSKKRSLKKQSDDDNGGYKKFVMNFEKELKKCEIISRSPTTVKKSTQLPVPEEAQPSGTKKQLKKRKIPKKQAEKKKSSLKLESALGCSQPEAHVDEDPARDAKQVLTWLLHPVSPERFFQQYWEEKPLHVVRAIPDFYKDIFSSETFDKILRSNNLHYTRNIDVVCYEDGVKQVFNQEGRATASALWDYYSNGCSIRILNPHTYSSKVQLLLATLQEFFGTMVGANVYLTPAGSQGFAPHFDDIEAFIIQLEGRKHWKLYYPKEAELLSRHSSGNFRREELDKPFMELTLEAGDLLYFSRGIIHEGFTDKDAHSLHITVSVYQTTAYADLLEHVMPAALKTAINSDIEFRKGLPLNYLKHFGCTSSGSSTDPVRNSVTKKVETLVQTLVNYLDLDRAADLLGRKFMHDSLPPVLTKHEVKRTAKEDGPNLNKGVVRNRVSIDLSTRIRLLRYYCIRLVKDDASVKLYYNTENSSIYHEEEEQWLEVDDSMITSIQKLQNAYPAYIEVGALPIEEDLVKLQLVSDLWEHGIVVTEKPLQKIE